MKHLHRFVMAASVGLLCSSVAQAQGASAPALALKGYDVVSYFSESRARQGTAELRVDFDGSRYYFSSARNKSAFTADPDRYLPQFGGYCAMGISVGKKFESEPTIFKIIDGKLYVFSSPKASDALDSDPEMLGRARQAWHALK
jgi:YHS domain-containing protein